MLPDWWKNSLKKASEDHKKILLKSTKNMKLSGFFSDFWGLKMKKIRPKLFVHVFLIENSCLNCLKVDRIQDTDFCFRFL